MVAWFRPLNRTSILAGNAGSRGLGARLQAIPQPTSKPLNSSLPTKSSGAPFFVLSGFLVSGLLFKEWKRTDSIDFRTFLLRRALKIVPPFLVLIGVTVLVSQFFTVSKLPLNGERIARELLFVQNYLPGMWNHTWSLAVEMHFYALLCVVTWCLVSRNDRHSGMRFIPRIVCVVALLCFLFRLSAFLLDYQASWIHSGTHVRIDTLMFGVLISHYWNNGTLRRLLHTKGQAIGLIFSGILLLLPAFLFQLETSPWFPAFGFVSNYLGSGALLVGFLSLQMPTNLLFRMIGRIGACSYSIYLWHMPMHEWIAPWICEFFTVEGLANWYLFAFVYITGSLILGILASEIIEMPILRLRNLICKPRSNAV